MNKEHNIEAYGVWSFGDPNAWDVMPDPEVFFPTREEAEEFCKQATEHYLKRYPYAGEEYWPGVERNDFTLYPDGRLGLPAADNDNYYWHVTRRNLWRFLKKDMLTKGIIQTLVDEFIYSIVFGTAMDFNIVGTELFLHYEPLLHFSLINEGKVVWDMTPGLGCELTYAMESVVPLVRDCTTYQICKATDVPHPWDERKYNNNDDLPF